MFSLQLPLGAMVSYYSCLRLSSGTKKMVICVSTVTQAKNGKSKFPKPAPRYLTASDRLLTKAFNTLVKFPTRSDNRFYRFFTQRKLSCVFLPESSTKHFCNLVNIPGEVGKRAKPVCNFCGQLPAVKPLQTQKALSNTSIPTCVPSVIVNRTRNFRYDEYVRVYVRGFEMIAGACSIFNLLIHR